MTQHQKIIELCKDGNWVCQNDFRANFIFSPHKRRIEIEGRSNQNETPVGRYIFKERACEHGIKGQKDYKMVENPEWFGYLSAHPRTTETELKNKIKQVQKQLI